eukprot:gene31112-6244_t
MAYVQSKEQAGWRLYFSSTADPSPKVELRDKTDKLDLATIARLFHLPIDDASKKLRTCSTKLKKLCRQKGLSRWPYREGKAPSPTPSTPKVDGVEGGAFNPLQGSPLHAPPTHAYTDTMGSTRVTTGAPPTALGKNMHGGGGLSPPNMDNPALQSCNNVGPGGGLDFSIPHPGFASHNAMSGEVIGQHAAGTNRGQEDLLDLDFSIHYTGFAPDNSMLGEVVGQHAVGTNRGQEEDLLDLDLMDLDLLDLGGMGEIDIGLSPPNMDNPALKSRMGQEEDLLDLDLLDWGLGGMGEMVKAPLGRLLHLRPISQLSL